MLTNTSASRVLVDRLIKRQKYNKLNKSVWGMPRLSEAMKDVISCEKLRGGAHIL